ncbi:hypothetical protein [Lutibacter citreus]|uniref:hypothetical protein n=1 Tax=Lutibacter citreus TaxID=2138210 RepID=UPI000DBE19FA|nr:hypothetical protein [Lutibacter citreus]
MKKYPPQYLFFIFVLLINFAFCQDNNSDGHQLQITIPDVALISVHNNNSAINLKGNEITEAGKKLTFNSPDNSTWINYSSIIGSKNESHRFVSLEISEGEVPDGLNLLVTASKDAGKGNGEMGVPIESNQILDEAPIKIIKNIGSCYTGVGVNNGTNIKYELVLNDKVDSYSKLNFNQSQTISLTYTLSDN